jgi:hypothetical protein
LDILYPITATLINFTKGTERNNYKERWVPEQSKGDKEKQIGEKDRIKRKEKDT